MKAYKIIQFSTVITIGIFGVFLTACSSFFPDDPFSDSKITIDSAVLVNETTIPVSGGSITINNGSSIDGFSLTVPPGSFNSQKTFKISTAEIISHDMGTYFNPISPLIKIEYEGGYADSLIELTIPIELPPDHYAMGFYYDDKTGVLEGIPVLELTDTYITLATRHFMSGADLHPDDSETKSVNISLAASCNLVITSLAETELYNKPIISTGFFPGIDDYEFVNYGSYIAPGGHCAGQSITMMWYYYEKTLLGESNLYHRFDLLNDPSKPEFMWMDNPYYFRFASVIQQDLDWGSNFFKLLKKIRVADEYHHLSWKSFILSLLLTRHPQYVGLTSQKGGHAILAHKISPAEGILYVTDPNFPGQEKQIKYENGKFSPYNTKLNASENSPYAFTGVGYTAVSALVDWDKISSRYNEVLDSTIGTITPNTFPDYTIWAIEKEVYTEITNADEITFSINSDTLRCIVECQGAERFWNIDDHKRIDFEVYSETGQKVDVSEGKGQRYMLLNQGLNKLGFYILGWREGYTYSNGNDIDYFIDFKWLTIFSSPLGVTLSPVSGLPGETVHISAVIQGDIPEQIKLAWNFGDGTPEITILNDTTVQHVFNTLGLYSITLKIYNNLNQELLASASTTATIGEEADLLTRLQQYPYIQIYFDADFLTTPETADFGIVIYNSPPYENFTNAYPDMEWKYNASGRLTFYSEYLYRGQPPGASYTLTWRGSVNGEMSNDGTKIDYLYANQIIDASGVTHEESYFQAYQIPYDPDYEYDVFTPRFYINGYETCNHFIPTNIRRTSIQYNSDGTTTTFTLDTILCESTRKVPTMDVFFLR